MTRRLFSFFLLLVSSSCFCGEIEDALSRAGLVESKIPTGDEWSSANRNLVDFVIAHDAEHLTINEVRDLRGPENRKIAFHDTLLISVNKGEWGGHLSVVGSDGNEHILIRDNIVQLVQEQDELFVFTGLAHMGSAQGAIYKITGNREDVSAEKVTLLPGAPQVVTVERNERGYLTFLIVTNDGLLSFNPKSGEMKILAIDQFWHGLYPTSAQLLDGQLIVGMRSGVAVVSIGQRLGIGSSPRVTKTRYFSRAVQ